MTEDQDKEKLMEDIFQHFDIDWESFKKDEVFNKVSSHFISFLETGDEFYRGEAYKAALLHYDEAVKVFKGKLPVNDKFWFKMGLVYRKVGKALLKEASSDYHKPVGYQKAIECFQKAVEFNPAFKEAWLILALSYDKLANFYHQKTLLRSELDSLKIDNYYQNSIACLKNELDCLGQVLKLDPNETKTAFWKKSIELRLGLFKELWQSGKKSNHLSN